MENEKVTPSDCHTLSTWFVALCTLTPYQQLMSSIIHYMQQACPIYITCIAHVMKWDLNLPSASS